MDMGGSPRPLFVDWSRIDPMKSLMNGVSAWARTINVSGFMETVEDFF